MDWYMWQQDLELRCSAGEGNHEDNVILEEFSNFKPHRQKGIGVLTGLIRPRSPWRASVGASSVAIIPRLLHVATTLAPIFPLLPTPHTTSLPCSLQLRAIVVTALAKLFLEKASFWYRFSRCAKAARSVEMTCRASLIAVVSEVECVPSVGSGGVIGSVGIGSETGAGHIGIDGVTGVGSAACPMDMLIAMLTKICLGGRSVLFWLTKGMSQSGKTKKSQPQNASPPCNLQRLDIQ